MACGGGGGRHKVGVVTSGCAYYDEAKGLQEWRSVK